MVFSTLDPRLLKGRYVVKIIIVDMLALSPYRGGCYFFRVVSRLE